jgi:hypothetical protein
VPVEFNWPGGSSEAFVNQLALADRTLSDLAAKAQREAAKVVCPVHGGHPTLKTAKLSTGGHDLQIVGACCDELRDAVKAASERAVRQS